MLATNAGDDLGADFDELILRVEIVEGSVFGNVERGEDQVADFLSALQPSHDVRILADFISHGSERDTLTVNGGGEIGAEAQQIMSGRELLGILIRALVGNAGEARTVVIAGVVGAEAFDKTGAASVAILHQPLVPTRAGDVGREQQLFIVGGPCEFPGSRCNRHDHLNLAEAGLRCLIVGRQLAVFTLQCEERHVGVARDVRTKFAVDERFVWAALLPDAAIDRAFN